MFLAAVLAIALIWASGIGMIHVNWPRAGEGTVMTETGFRDNKKSFYIDGGDEYGVVYDGPGFTLPAGVYRLKWTIETDADNLFRIVSSNGASIEPSEIAIPANTWTSYAEFELKEDADDLQILVDFEAGSKLQIQQLELRSCAFADQAWNLTFFVVALYLLYVAYSRGQLTEERRSALFVLGVTVVIASIPALKDNLYLGHDAQFNLARFKNLADGLTKGQIPVRAGGYSYEGYGAITSAFYPDIFLYIPALIMLSGASIQYAVHVLWIALHIFTAVSMYVCAKRIFDDVSGGLCAAVLYTLAAYRLSDVYTRFAIGEALAMAFIPLFFLGLWEIAFGDRERWIVLVIGATGIFQSHLLATVICALAAVCFYLPLVGKIVRERRLTSLGKAVVSTVLVNLFFLVPFVMYSRQGIGADSILSLNSMNAFAPAQLFLLGRGQLDAAVTDGRMAMFSLEIGYPLIVGAVIGVKEALGGKGMKEKFVLLLGAMGAIFAFMTTELFPWDFVAAVTHTWSNFLQFPWRMLMIVDAVLALAAGFGYARVFGGKKDLAAVLVLMIAGFAVLPQLSSVAASKDCLAYGETITSKLMHREYTLPETDVRQTSDRGILSTGDVLVQDYQKDGTTITANVSAQTDASISFPLFGFDGYKATLDGMEIPWTLGENNRLTVSLAPDEGGELRVWFAGRTIWRVADGVSLAAIVVLALITLCGRRGEAVRRKKNEQ